MKYTLLLIIIFFGFQSGGVAKELKLNDYLAKVKESNKDIKLAKQDLAVAEANNQEAWSLALPKISAEATYNHNFKDIYMYADFSSFGLSGIQKFRTNRNNTFGLTAGITQTLFSLEVNSALKAASEYEKMTDFIYNASEQQVITAAKKVFYQTLLLKKVWEVSKAAEENAEKNYLNVKVKFENGVASEFEMLQAEVRWKNLIPQTAESKRNMDIALINLKNLAGIPIEEQLDPAGQLDVYPTLPQKLTLEEILKSRPDYNALLWEEKLRTTNISAERANFYPKLSASLGYSYSAQSDDFKLEEENHAIAGGLTLSIPLYTGGYTDAQVEKAIIDRNKTQIEIEKNTDQIFQEISQIWLRLEEANKRIESSRSTLQTAKKAFEIAEVSNQQGLATQLELKDSRVAYDQANLTYFAAVYDYLAAYFDWEQAIGKVSFD
ncbi:outer membrane efflux protein [Chloroherpeton thalassium ATCC 35110]|uniref:Outer membrane efflux protein n=1 Tax=Chloroherpeton thalassium (strain ATCC 35110 / GB-78) TaxID=517418 RepID=B3QYV0_CHLT3|nr:TolC family protein [Chloroherpeton thalassium]ACF15173.1 outer membrane efflux protein [Chloroherpeton thalassium ATCC 35110]